METKDLNSDLKEEVSRIFTSLFKEIGSNRQQLANKVLGHQTEIFRELNKEEAGDQRRKEILAEIARTVKMAHQQLPHLKLNPPRPSPKAAPKPQSEKPPKPLAPPAKVAPPKAPAAHPAKTSAKAEKTKPSLAKKTGSKPAKKKK